MTNEILSLAVTPSPQRRYTSKDATGNENLSGMDECVTLYQLALPID